jgi:hypothetical protein
MNEPNGAIGGDKTEYRKISGDYVEKVSSLEKLLDMENGVTAPHPFSQANEHIPQHHQLMNITNCCRSGEAQRP